MLMPELVSSYNISSESTEITTFMEDLPSRIIGMTFDSNGNMYVGTIGNQAQKKILKIAPDANISSLKSIECFAIEYLKAGRNDTIYFSVITDNT
jgi:hypothetical protein